MIYYARGRRGEMAGHSGAGWGVWLGAGAGVDPACHAGFCPLACCADGQKARRTLARAKRQLFQKFNIFGPDPPIHGPFLTFA